VLHRRAGESRGSWHAVSSPCFHRGDGKGDGDEGGGRRGGGVEEGGTDNPPPRRDLAPTDERHVGGHHGDELGVRLRRQTGHIGDRGSDIRDIHDRLDLG